MVDAKRVIEKYKAQEDEEKKTQKTLRAEIAQLKAGGAGAGGEGGGGGGGQQAAKMEELEMQVAQLKMNLATAAEDADTSKSKLEKFKAAASEKMKQDRARYLEHLQVRARACSVWRACVRAGGRACAHARALASCTHAARHRRQHNNRDHHGAEYQRWDRGERGSRRTHAFGGHGRRRRRP